MRCGVISDIHGNLEGLLAVLEALGDVDLLISAGDIVGYGPDPNACCEIMQEQNALCVLGNHDAAVIGRMPIEWFNPIAADALLWTREQITEENQAFLETLPLVHWDDTFVLTHASLSAPEEYEYITSSWEARPSFAEMGPLRLCFIGHTHIAEFYWQRIGEIWVHQVNTGAGGIIELQEDVRYIVNSGSAGQPRDFDARSSAAIYDSEAQTIEVLRVEYPITDTQRKMRAAGLPEPLIRRLEYGT